MKNKIDKFINKNILNILSIFLLSQPILDVFSSIQAKSDFAFFPLGEIFRTMFLLFIVVYIVYFSKSKFKKISIYYIFTITIFIILFLINIYYAKISLIIDFKWIIKNFYFPILLVGFLNIFDTTKKYIDYKILSIILINYVLLILLSWLFSYEYNAYTQGKVGYIGIFYSANEISSIISILMPFLFFLEVARDKLYLKLLALLSVAFCCFMIGSKTAVLSLMIIAVIYFILYIKNLIKNRRFNIIKLSAITFIMLFTSIALILPYTSFYKNTIKHIKFLQVDSIVEVFNYNNLNRLVFSDRLTFLKNKQIVYNKAPLGQKLIGIGYNQTPKTINLKNIEIDYLDIYYGYGPIGFIIYFIPLILMLFLIIKKIYLLKDRSPYFIALFLIIILAMFTGHVFTAPAVSIYCALIIAYLYREVL